MKTALIAVQLEVEAGVLASADAYRRHLEAAVDRAVAGAGAADARLVVVPELAGHLALLALAPPAAHRARSLGAALAAAAVRRPLDVLRGVASARTLQPRDAVLAALAPDGERYWRSIFAPLARRHAASIVAGSHLRLRESGAVTNASLLFSPDGRCAAVTEKVNLLPGLEDGAPGGLGLARGSAEQVPIAGAGLGRVCTLIGYDACHVAHTPGERFVPVGESVYARGGADVVANPSASPRRGREPEQPQPLASGLAAALVVLPFARWGVTAQLVGEVLDLRFGGASEIVERVSDGVRVVARTDPDRGTHVATTVTW